MNIKWLRTIAWPFFMSVAVGGHDVFVVNWEDFSVAGCVRSGKMCGNAVHRVQKSVKIRG